MKRILCLWLRDAKPEIARQDSPRETLAALADECRRFSPVVGVEEGDAPECVFLDIGGVAWLFGGEAALVRRTIDQLTRQGHDVRAAVADTIGAAWAAARFGATPLGATPLAASQPAASPLGGLPVEALRLSEKTVDLLDQLGIFTIGQVEALPRNELVARFGAELPRRLDQAAGRLDEPIPACAPPPRWKETWSAEHPTARPEAIEAVLEQLILQVASRLAESGRGALRLECRLRCAARGTGGPAADGSTRLSVGLFEPTASARRLFELTRIQLERLRLPGLVEAVEVEATLTATLPVRQQEMPFGDGDAPMRSARHLTTLIERLGARLGRAAVVRPRLVADALPELAWRYDALVGETGRRARRRARRAETLPPRPLCLLRRPMRLGATSSAPEGPPSVFHADGRRHCVARSAGPERIETGWWRGQAVGRDYYRVETGEGRRCWIFRRLRDGLWFLHGWFG